MGDLTINPAPVVDNGIDTAALAAAPTVVTETTPSRNAPDPSPAVETTPDAAPPVEAPVETPAPANTVLAEAIDKNTTTETPVETPVVPENTAETVVPETNNEGSQSEETAPPPKFDPFTLPEGVSLSEERMGEFTNLLTELEQSGKADHAAVQQFGQKAVEFHVNEINKAIETYNQSLSEAWTKQQNTWKEEFLSDPEIGGNRFQTTVDSALEFIRTHGGNPEQQTELRNLMESSGLGNHKAVIRLFANAGRAMSEGKPLAVTQPVPAPKSKVSTMYGANK